MRVSGREAASMLAEAGVARRQARLILDAGLAGSPERAAGALLYDADRVAALVARPSIDRRTVYSRCPHGLLLDRRGVGLTREAVELALPLWVGFELRMALHRGLGFPYVATVGGFVVRGADIVAVRSCASETYELDLAVPGDWFDGFRGTRWPIGPGPAWQLIRPIMGE